MLIDHSEHKQGKIFPLKTSEGFISIPFENILYVESVSRTICIHCIDGAMFRSVFIRKNFETEIDTLLQDDCFIQTHKSFAINVSYINKMNGQCFIIKGDTYIPIARKRQAAVRKQYLQFLNSDKTT